MTDLLHDTGEIRLTGTRDLTYLLRPPVFGLRRPGATGEQPIYQPATIGVVDELQRLAVGATMVLPVDATPVPPREPMPTVYHPAVADVVKPFLGRGIHRAPAEAWARRALLVGLGSVGTVVLELAGIAALAVLR